MSIPRRDHLPVLAEVTYAVWIGQWQVPYSVGGCYCLGVVFATFSRFANIVNVPVELDRDMSLVRFGKYWIANLTVLVHRGDLAAMIFSRFSFSGEYHPVKAQLV